MIPRPVVSIVIRRSISSRVSTTEPYTWGDPRATYHIAAYDYGIKFNILRNLVGVGCAVRVVPASTPARDVLAIHRLRQYGLERFGDFAVQQAPFAGAQLVVQVLLDQDVGKAVLRQILLADQQLALFNDQEIAFFQLPRQAPHQLAFVHLLHAPYHLRGKFLPEVQDGDQDP